MSPQSPLTWQRSNAAGSIPASSRIWITPEVATTCPRENRGRSRWFVVVTVSSSASLIAPLSRDWERRASTSLGAGLTEHATLSPVGRRVLGRSAGSGVRPGSRSRFCRAAARLDQKESRAESCRAAAVTLVDAKRRLHSGEPGQSTGRSKSRRLTWSRATPRCPGRARLSRLTNSSAVPPSPARRPQRSRQQALSPARRPRLHVARCRETRRDPRR